MPLRTRHPRPNRRRPAVAAEISRGDDTDMLRLARVAEPAVPLWWRETLSLATFGEIAVAYWRFPRLNAASRRHIKVVGVTTDLRLRDTWTGRWLFDAGIGVNALSDLYEARDRRFSTRLEFSDHLAVGRGFGDGDAIELRSCESFYCAACWRRCACSGLAYPLDMSRPCAPRA